MAGLISDNINQRLNTIIGKSNDINRLLDRHISLMTGKFLMKKTAHALHPDYAHYFSLILSDSVGEYQEERFNLTEYPGTDNEIGRRDYNTPKEMFDDEATYIIDLETYINETISVARDAEDETTVLFLHKALEKFIHIEYLCLCLCNASAQKIEDYLQLDDYIINQLEVVLKKD